MTTQFPFVSSGLVAAALWTLVPAAIFAGVPAGEPGTEPIRKEVTVPATPAQVFEAWTTLAGVRSFFAPDANMELRIGGPYEMLFDPEANEGGRGSEGCRILSYLPGEMLSFDWNNPPKLPSIRQEKTWVVVRFDDAGGGRTRLTLTHLGWRTGGEWPQAHAYFERAWDVVLYRLLVRFEKGPINWSKPPYPPAGNRETPR